ncbi:hypothetical protein APS56_01365 [Pseudalgibacter alginicilyticus]|uniref:Uncharacterized protein n=1 Tax=Pseudalgibacter alginicilyticus TaxID=1736674 RepID=A0A0P0CD18_9FLAO|nr:hypothetical protein [Pseudalgibacter alginicilyticus]ALJ03881.1 hypothetical protein APS56_01365 [Pseudalgibacter alginicilyticus]
MSVTESTLYPSVIAQETIALGNLFFFDNYVIAEFHEGVNISYENFKESKVLMKKYFGNRKFGFIGNRINSYSIVISEAPLFNETFKNLSAYATVTYNAFAEKVFDVENHFFKFNKKNFTCLLESTNWVEKTLKNQY